MHEDAIPGPRLAGTGAIDRSTPAPSIRERARLRAGAPPDDDVVRRLVIAGTDHRARLDRHTGRNAYGCAPLPRAVPFGACSASEPDPDLLAEALRTVADPSPLAERYDRIRAELVALLGLPAGTTVVLTPSGTDAVYVAVAQRLAAQRRPVASVIVGAEEVGRGTLFAAGGLHFSATPPRPDTGRRVGLALRGWPIERTHVTGVSLRDGHGAPLPSDQLDAHVREAVERHRASGHDVLLHVNAGSKTGLCGPSDALLAELRVAVMVDAAQGRLAPHAIARYLAGGAMVVFTASKFFGAPAFAGALLLPPRTEPATDLPEGLGDYLCDHAVPGGAPLADSWQNDGLWFRWQLGLLAIERYLCTPVAARVAVGAAFARAATALASPRIDVEPDTDASAERIVTFVVRDRAGDTLPQPALQAVHHALCEAGILVGQPVALAPDRVALRLSLSAPTVTRLAATPDHGLGWLTEQVGAVRRVVEAVTDRERP